MTTEQDEWIEKWLLNRLGEGNRFEQFNRQFCKDLINDYKPIIEKAERGRIRTIMTKLLNGKAVWINRFDVRAFLEQALKENNDNRTG